MSYDVARLRARAEKSPFTVAVDSGEMLEMLADMEKMRATLKRIVGWDYPCRDEGCEAGEVAARGLEEVRR